MCGAGRAGTLSDPADAWAVLSTSFYEGGSAVALTARQHADLLGRLAETGVAGGRTSDAIVAECALRAGAVALLTFNARHFEPAPEGIEIVVPA